MKKKLESLCPSDVTPCSESSFCYEVGIAGMPSAQVATMLQEDWKNRGGNGPIPILQLGGGWWVIDHLERSGVSVLRIEVNYGDVLVRAVTELAYNVMHMTHDPKKVPRRSISHAVANGNRTNRGGRPEAGKRGAGVQVAIWMVWLYQATGLKAVFGRIVHRSKNSLPNAKEHPTAEAP